MNNLINCAILKKFDFPQAFGQYNTADFTKSNDSYLFLKVKTLSGRFSDVLCNQLSAAKEKRASSLKERQFLTLISIIIYLG
ncbi:MAG: hypothetical protein WCH65_04010 [bacterium]